MRLQLQSAEFTAGIGCACNRKWSRWETESFAELWGVRTFRRPLVFLTFLAAGTAAALAIKLGPSRLSQNSWMCRASTVTKESKGGHLSRGGTRGPVSRRKCSANHRLSTDHRLRSTTSWAINLSPGWTCNTSILQGREDAWTGKPASWDTPSFSHHFHYPLFLYIQEPYNAGNSHGLLYILFLFPLFLPVRQQETCLFLTRGRQLPGCDPWRSQELTFYFWVFHCWLYFSLLFFVRSLGSVMKKHLLKPEFSPSQGSRLVHKISFCAMGFSIYSFSGFPSS